MTSVIPEVAIIECHLWGRVWREDLTVTGIDSPLLTHLMTREDGWNFGIGITCNACFLRDRHHVSLDFAPAGEYHVDGRWVRGWEQTVCVEMLCRRIGETRNVLLCYNRWCSNSGEIDTVLTETQFITVCFLPTASHTRTFLEHSTQHPLAVQLPRQKEEEISHR